MALSEFESSLSHFEAAFDIAQARLRRFVENKPDQFPLFTQQGRWRLTDAGRPSPFVGCLPAMMWDFYDACGDVYWRETAEHYCRLIDTLWTDGNGPGGGFACFFGGHRRWYDAALREGGNGGRVRERLIRVGQNQASGFLKSGGCFAFDQGQSLLGIERILDVPIILFAAAETQDPELFEVAARHCAATRKHLVRGDGSVASAVRMNPTTGEFGGPIARAGYRGDSTWACGQAWAILGFATAGRLEGFEPWLQTARQAAQFVAERLSGDPVPAWDFDAPADPHPQRDSAAAAVAAAALLELADAEQTVGREQARDRRRLQEVALRVLDALCSPEYLAGLAGEGGAPTEGLLRHAVGNLPTGWAVDESVIWGDAFLVRALHRAIRLLRHA